MRITLLTMGKTDIRWVSEGLEMYSSRLVHYVPFCVKELPELKGTGALSHDQVKQKEAEVLLKAVKPSDMVVLLDEHGEQFSSLEFAARAGKWLQAGQYDRKTGKYNASGTHYEGFDRVFEWWIDEETLSFVQRINGKVVLKQTEHYVVTGDTLFNKDSLFTGTIDIDGDELTVTTDNWIMVFTRIE